MFKNLRVRTQLLGLSGFFLLMLLASGALSVGLLKDQARGARSMYEDRVVALRQLKVVSDMYAVNIVDTAHKVRDGGLAPRQGIELVAQARKEIDREWRAYNATEMTAEETRIIGRLKPLMQVADKAVDHLDQLLATGDLTGLKAYAATEMYPALDPLQTEIGNLVQLQQDESRLLYQGADVAYREALSMVAAFVVLSLVAGGALAWLITRRLTQALGAEPHEVRALAQAVSEGRLDQLAQLRAGDKVSVMAFLVQMSAVLRDMVQTIRENAESVATASAQISLGNADLSSRTEEQASALEQTAASMEELTSTVSHNAENARQAACLAHEASDTAGRGGEVVEDMVRTMQRIDGSSRKIVDIISVIDSIAFQTNILALNAAVEAARAGEQGRGFAVVASEVRTLAQRSASAAREVKQLITTSVEQVSQGGEQAGRAGTTMRDVVEAIRKVSEIVAEISAASREQTTGIGQISEAVNQMDQATQQNAALVEESAAAANSLNRQAQELVRSVGRFRTGTGDGEHQPMPRQPALQIPLVAPTQERIQRLLRVERFSAGIAS